MEFVLEEEMKRLTKSRMLRNEEEVKQFQHAHWQLCRELRNEENVEQLVTALCQGLDDQTKSSFEMYQIIETLQLIHSLRERVHLQFLKEIPNIVGHAKSWVILMLNTTINQGKKRLIENGIKELNEEEKLVLSEILLEMQNESSEWWKKEDIKSLLIAIFGKEEIDLKAEVERLKVNRLFNNSYQIQEFYEALTQIWLYGENKKEMVRGILEGLDDKAEKGGGSFDIFNKLEELSSELVYTVFTEEIQPLIKRAKKRVLQFFKYHVNSEEKKKAYMNVLSAFDKQTQEQIKQLMVEATFL